LFFREKEREEGKRKGTKGRDKGKRVRERHLR